MTEPRERLYNPIGQYWNRTRMQRWFWDQRNARRHGRWRHSFPKHWRFADKCLTLWRNTHK